MQNQKIKYTNHKFYGKWLYKVTLNLKGCVMLRLHTINAIKDFCNGPEPDVDRYRYKQEHWRNREEILALCEFLESYDKTQYSTRIERHCIDLYTNDLDFYNTAAIKFALQLKHCFEPSDKSADLLNTWQTSDQFSTYVEVPVADERWMLIPKIPSAIFVSS
jgi:hypothetical protein